MEQHTIPPVFDSRCNTLVLGTFPSVKSRETGFFYGHPQNRFWKVLALVLGEDTPSSTAEKTALLLSRHIALWDVIASCDITGSSDSSISNVTPNDIAGLLAKAPIQQIFTNGGTAHKLYQKHCHALAGIADVCLPSTSAANAAYSLSRLAEAWGVINA